MIAPVQRHHDRAIADFWVRAWQATFPDIDFEARRAWILGHLVEMRANGNIVRGYFHGGEVIGFYSLFPDAGVIEQICVSQEATGRGIGGALVGDAANVTRVRLNLVVNDDNDIARRFYAKLGFIERDHRVDVASRRRVIALEMAVKSAR